MINKNIDAQFDSNAKFKLVINVYSTRESFLKVYQTISFKLYKYIYNKSILDTSFGPVYLDFIKSLESSIIEEPLKIAFNFKNNNIDEWHFLEQHLVHEFKYKKESMTENFSTIHPGSDFKIKMKTLCETFKGINLFDYHDQTLTFLNSTISSTQSSQSGNSQVNEFV